jgi:hypothetical protein
MSDFTEEQEPKFDFQIPDDWSPSLRLAFAELMDKALADGFPVVIPVRGDATPDQIEAVIADMRALVKNAGLAVPPSA